MTNANKSEWTQVITSSNKWYDFNLKEIWNYRDLLTILVKRDLSTIYKQTVLGPVWFLFGPLFTVFTYTFVFSEIAGISTDEVPAPVFYLSGTVLWNYFSACFNGSSTIFVSYASIFGKVYFPRLIPPLALIVSNLVKFGLQMIVFLVFCLYYYSEGEIDPNLNVLLFPLLLLLMAGLSLGIGIMISSMGTKYRDINQLVGVFTTILMYASPIIYPTSKVPSVYRPFVDANPIAPIINAFRYGFTGAGSVNYGGIIYSAIFTVVVLIVGTIMFNRVEKTFIDTV